MTKKAERHNEGKPVLSFNMLGREVAEGEAKVWEAGALKYSRGNWQKGQLLTTAADSLLRHTAALLNGEDNDPETGLPHVDHIVTSAKILSHSFHTRKDLDDRNDEKIKRVCSTCRWNMSKLSEPCCRLCNTYYSEWEPSNAKQS